MRKSKISKHLITALAFLSTTLGIIITIYLIVVHDSQLYSKNGVFDLTKGSEFGDFIGGFAGIFFTISGVFLLYRTMSMQREEFSKTEKAITTQQFETTFFNMMNVLQNIILSTSKSNSGNTENGYNYFHILLTNLKQKLNEKLSTNQQVLSLYNEIGQLNSINDTEILNLENEISKVYESFYNENHSYFGHYFRYLFNIMKFVIENKIEDKQKYMNLIQAQLSNQELGLIFYNSISKVSENSNNIKQFKEWLSEYYILENIDLSSLDNKYHHVIFKNTSFKFLNSDEKIWKQNGMKKLSID